MREITIGGGGGDLSGTMQLSGPARVVIELAEGESVLIEINPLDREHVDMGEGPPARLFPVVFGGSEK